MKAASKREENQTGLNFPEREQARPKVNGRMVHEEKGNKTKEEIRWTTMADFIMQI